MKYCTRVSETKLVVIINRHRRIVAAQKNWSSQSSGSLSVTKFINYLIISEIMYVQSMNHCESLRVLHSLQVLKLYAAKLVNQSNRKGNPCATLYQVPHNLVTRQFVGKEMTTMLPNAY